jgi:hypothetical protein
MAGKRIPRVDVRQKREIIAHDGVVIKILRNGKSVKTSLLIGLEIICANIEQISDPKEIKLIEKSLAIAKKNM